MLLHSEDTQQENVDKLLAFATNNNLKLLLVNESGSNGLLPGKPLTEEQLLQLIDKSRNGGMISMNTAHQITGSRYNAD